MPLDLEKANRDRLIDYLKRKGESGLSSLRKEELLKMAKRAQRSAAKNHSSRSRSPHRSARRNSGRKHRGGHKSDENPVDLLQNVPGQNVLAQIEQFGGKNKTPRRKHKGGQQTSGATFLPARFFDPEAALPKQNDANSIKTPYGQINSVSGSCRNLAPFPNPTDQQTGGKKKKPATKKSAAKKSATKKPAPKKPAAKKPAAKKTATPKRKKSLWDKLMGLF